MNSDFIQGVIVPILMPIDKSENINEKKLRQHVDFVIEGGVNGILLFGSNGEFYAMETEEIAEATDIVINQVKKRVPVYIGVGNITTRKCVKIARMAADKGAQGISLLQPMFIAPKDDELYDHFMTVAEAVPEMPVLIYNNPRAGYGMSPALVAKLAENVENIVGIKDSSGNMSTLSEYIRLTRDMDFRVLAGKDTMIMTSLAAGAVGCIATTANFLPGFVCDIYNLYMTGDLDKSRDAQYRLTPVRNILDMACFPVGTKDIANLMGMEVGDPYLPNKSTTGVKREQMKQILKDLGILE